MPSLALDKETFYRRLKHLYDFWKVIIIVFKKVIVLYLYVTGLAIVIKNNTSEHFRLSLTKVFAGLYKGLLYYKAN